MAGYFSKIIGIQELVSSRKSWAVQEFKKYFDWKFGKKTVPYVFVVWDVVLINIKNCLRDIKNVGAR